MIASKYIRISCSFTYLSVYIWLYTYVVLNIYFCSDCLLYICSTMFIHFFIINICLSLWLLFWSLIICCFFFMIPELINHETCCTVPAAPTSVRLQRPIRRVKTNPSDRWSRPKDQLWCQDDNLFPTKNMGKHTIYDDINKIHCLGFIRMVQIMISVHLKIPDFLDSKLRPR